MKTINVVAAIIIKNGRIFATQRGYGDYRDWWEFPGGKIEEGETPKEALVREIREELRAEIKVGELFRTVEYDYPEFHMIMRCYLCELVSERIELVEHEAARWLGADDIESVKWLPSDTEIVESLKGYLEEREEASGVVGYAERKGTNSVKWDALEESFGADGLLPLWVADMDFRADEHITAAVSEYLKQGVFGYYDVPDSYFDAFIEWESREHAFVIEREWIRYSPGVVSGFNFALQILSGPGDAVIVNTPVYYPFLRAVENNGRRLICSELVNRDGRYYVDTEDFERKLSENDVKVFMLCSPHNPVSRVWSEEELRTLLGICRKHGVAVIADEIHHDLTFGGAVHVPAMSLAGEGDRMIMLTAASKTFNIAAFRNSFVVIRDAEIRDRWDSFVAGLSISSGDPLGYITTEAAYRYGRKWLDEVREIIYGNYIYLKDFFSEALPEVCLSPLEGTYLAWADFGAYLKPEEVQPFMQDECRLAFDYGSWFGGDRSGSFIRINLATSRENIEEMARRIRDGMAER